MRSAAPWLGSLFLHSLFLIGIISLTRTPPELPQTLTLDFLLIAPAVPEPGPAAPPASKPVESKPVESKPLTQEKSPQPVEPVATLAPVATISEMPPPVKELPLPAEELPVVEPGPESTPKIQPSSATDEVQPPTESPKTEAVSQDAMLTDNTVASIAGDVESELAVAERQIRTVNHVRAQVLGTLNYPAVARRKGWCGRLVLGFVLCADGSVEELEVVESSGYRILDRAALQAVTANIPFSGGYPRTVIRLPINFELD